MDRFLGMKQVAPANQAPPPPPGYVQPNVVAFTTQQTLPGQPAPAYTYPPPAYPPGYAPQPQPIPQTNTNVVVVGGQQQPSTVTVVEQRPRVNHLLHLIITLIFFPWIIVWFILILQEGIIT